MNDKSNATGARAKRTLAYIPVTAVVCVGVVLSIIIFAVTRQWEQRRITSELERTARTQVSLFKEQTGLHELELKSTGAFFAGSIEVERAEFSTFVNVFLRVHTDMQALAWAPRVKKSDAANYVDAAVRDGLSDFQITERRADGQPVKVASRDEYFPIFYIEPFKTNASMMGFDVASNAQILEALKRSRRSGRQTVTPKLELLPQRTEDPALLIVQPLYYRDAPTDTEQARVANLQGFAVGIFHVGEILEASLAILAEAQIDLFVYDQTAPRSERFMYGHVSRPEQKDELAEIWQADIEKGLYYSETFAVADRRWRIVCVPTPDYIEARKTAQPWWNLSGGLFVTAVVGSYLMSLVRRGEHVDQLVKQQTANLEQEVAERKRTEEQLRDLTSTLESRNKELRTYTTIVRHDLGNQLLSINAFNSVLAKSCKKLGRLLDTQKLQYDVREQVFSVLKDEIARTTDHIKVGTGQMSSLLEGLKRLGEVGYVELQIEPLDMNRLIRQLTGTMKAEITNRGASVGAEELPACFGDTGQVNQVFSNLLNNALKYLDPGRKGQIRIWGRVEDGHSIYCVEDNGIGIAPQEQSRVFEAFHCADPGNPASGEGLGLSIVVRILERLNGKIELQSEPGKGSAFYVSLPAAHEMKEEQDIQ